MTEQTRTIPLMFNRLDFENFFELRKYGNLIRNPYTRGYCLFIAILVFALFISLYFSLSENKLVVLTVMLILCLILAIIFLFVAAWPYLAWKKNTNVWLNKMGCYKSQKLILTPVSMSLIQDDSESIEKWSAISNVKIEANSLTINGSQQFIFLKASMTESDFEYLKERVSVVMKNVL